MDITSDTIKNIAVDCVTQFINNKQDLSAGLAKHASDLGLNADQIKRSVEATNQIGYLKLLGMNSDRTFEFPVAKYEDVMKHMVMPTESQEFSAPSAETSSAASGNTTETAAPPQIDLAEKQAMARIGVLSNHVSLADLEIEKAAVLMQIGDLVKKIKKDEWVIEKLAEIATEDEFPKLVKLATGKDACDVDVRKHVFNDSELSEARTLSGLLKKAYEVVQRESTAQEIDSKHYKQGDLYKSAAIGGTEPIRRPTRVGNTLASITSGTSKAVSYGAGVLSAPITIPAAAMGRRVAAGTENVLHSALGPRLSEGILGPKKFQPAKPFRRLLPKAISPLDVAFAAATPLDPEKSVWNTLQGSGKRY